MRRFILLLFTVHLSLFTFKAMAQDDVISKLEVYDLATRQHTVVKTFPYKIEAPNWTPDGKWFVYNSNGRLFKLSAENPSDNPIEINTGSATGCNNDHVISADGSWIGLSDKWPSKVFRVPFEGGDPIEITPNGPSYLHGISPDGKEVAYCAFRGNDRAVYSKRLDGSPERCLTNAPGLNDGPEYSPDGKHIWYNSTRTGLMQVWRMKTDGSEQTQMTFDENLNSWFPHVSPDGKWVVYICYHRDDLAADEHVPNKNVLLRMMKAKGGKPETIVELFGGQGTINVNSWAPDSRKFAYVSYELKERDGLGIQMYSLRDLLGTHSLYEKNGTAAINQLKSFGYTKAELYGYENGKFFGVDADKVLTDLRCADIEPFSSHINHPLSEAEIASGDYSESLAWWKKCIAEHKQMGIKNIVFAWYALPHTFNELHHIAAYLDQIGALCRAEGVRFGYHNHDHEMQKVEDHIMLDYLIENTKKENVFFEMDVYWTAYGKKSPTEYFRRYPGRFTMLHMKDQYELGKSGMVGFDAILSARETAGAKHLIIEQEYTQTGNILDDLKQDINYLQKKL